MFYEQLLDELANNCKLTSKRKEILKTLIKAKNHLSAKEIFDRVRKVYPGISFDTVYRNLAILKDLHIINQLDFGDGRGRYEINRRQDHHHHMICMKCGGAWKIPVCPMENPVFNHGPENFKAVNHRFEIFGYCQECQD